MTRLTFTNKVLPLFTFSLGIATIGAYIGMAYYAYIARPGVMILLYITEFVLLLSALFARKRHDVSHILLIAFVFVTGLVISPVISLYVLSYGASIVFQALVFTTIIFGALSYYAYMSGQNFSRIGGFLFSTLIGVIVVAFVNIFLRNSIIFVIVDIVSIVLFSGYVLYDMGNILNNYAEDDTVGATLALYIDFLNLFLNILQLLGIFERRKD